jgi:hypothetical protein
MRINENTTLKVYKCKMESIESMELKGYELIDELFVDSSGFGTDDEPALTAFNFERKVIELCKLHGTLTAKITNRGQFQVYVGLFKKVSKGIAKKLSGRNTYKIDYPTTDAIRFHDTDILVFESDHVTLNSGGYFTKTTKERMNTYLPDGVYINQKDFQWYINDSRDNSKKLFYDGITISN